MSMKNKHLLILDTHNSHVIIDVAKQEEEWGWI
jgi:hypothetical protein